ncbi:tubulin tyrosine ligase-like member 10, putative [Ichthyophthirius multifiliis]|uniref:Tubulin tyrosine ligase-like member 10, putative n=1 Tax=Ichthyophthirius multifiliis TaxID=5932 RepID=G0QJY0_ICHMU|nr:tubulin tyrosine ligase-like member 10, putative [Ichthyophthirius multifiliis]EGR34471.1 tubulin tyrosine ligase-like member 10, putative [Ichthyophthirius multifiliis]|eukprot:XP_004039775.1 tubulin tyrosine ligase-like member 10, putative [Ichthyophthirius multifiliis]
MKESLQLSNFINYYEIIDNKDQIIEIIENYQKQNFLAYNPHLLIPKSYNINLKKSYYSQEEKLFLQETEGAWIIKETYQVGGYGMIICSDVKRIQNDLQQMKQRKQKKNSQKYVIQRYIQNPLLYDGRKFDLRSYLLVASADPLIVYYVHGNMRLSFTKYNNNFTLLRTKYDDMSAHLINWTQQKKYVGDDEELNQLLGGTFADFENFLINSYGKTKEWIYENIYEKMFEIFAYIFEASKDQMKKKQGHFQIFGTDIMLDDNLNVYFIENNGFPGITYDDNKIYHYPIETAVNNTIRMATYVQEQQVKGQIIDTDYLNSICIDCTLIYNQLTNYSFVEKYRQK